MDGPAFQVAAVMRLVDMISGPLRFVQGNMGDTENSAAGLSAKMKLLTKSMLPIVMVAGLIVGGLSGAALAGVETGRALGELASVGVQDMAALEAAGRSFSNEWSGTSKAQFISAAYDIKSGISSLSDVGVAEFTKLAALTGKATKSTTGEMTSLFATGYGIYKDMYDDLSNMQFGELFSAGIAASVQSFKTTGSGMAQGISQLGAAATSAKIPLQEQLTILGMLQATMSGSEAGTKYKSFVNTAAGAGEKLGLQFMDANNQLLSMPSILNELKGKYGDTLNAMEKLELKKAFGTDEAVALIDLMYSKVDKLTENIDGISGAMGQGSSFTKVMAQAMNRDLGAVLQITGQRLHNLIEMVGKMFVPVLLLAGKAIGGVTLVLQMMADNPIGQTLLGLTGVIATTVLGLAAFALVSAGVSAALPIIMAQLGPVGAAIIGITWPIWLVIGAVGLLYLAWRNNFGGIQDHVTGFFNKVSLVFRGVRAIFASLTGSTWELSGALAADLKANGLLGLVVTVARVVYRISGFFSELWNSFAFTATGITDIFMPTLKALVFAFQPLRTIVKSVFGVLFGAAAATDAGPWRTLGVVVGVVLGSAFQLLGWAVRALILPLEFLLWIIGGVGHVFVWVGQVIGNTVGWVVTNFDTLTQTAGNVAESVMDWFGWLVGGIKWVFLNLTPVGWLIQAFSGLAGFNLFSSGAKLIETLTAGIKSKIMGPVEMVKAGFAKLRNLLPFSDAKEGPLSQLTLSGRKIMDTLGEGIRSAAPDLRGVAATALTGVALTAVTAMPLPAEAAQSAIEKGLPAPKIESRLTEEDRRRAVNKKEAGSGSSRRTSIVIQNLNLPGVKDADGFVEALQQLVEEYDV